MQRGFVSGDYEVQFYPWSFAYAESLKAGFLPLWTPLLQCGFPLFAEGQTGMLYLPNLAIFRLLPFREAYNAMFLLHFAAGAIFMYAYCRKRGISGAGAAMATAAFTFGSAYAGCFYNIVTLRALVWFPLCLVFTREFALTGKARHLFLLALALGQSWLAGFPQMTAYAAGFLLLSYGFDARGRGRGLAGWILFFLALGLSVVIALPQLWASFELAGHTTRALQDKGFIFWGSVGPWSALSAFLFSWNGMLGVGVYLGIVPLLFLAYDPKLRASRDAWILAGVAAFLALGAYNPLYWALVHVPVASLLRNPGKFLFFAAFYLCLAAGHGLDGFLADAKKNETEAAQRFVRRTLMLAMAFAVIAVAGWAVGRYGRPLLEAAGQAYVGRFVLNKSYHRWDAATYQARIESILTIISLRTDLKSPFLWVPFLYAGLTTIGVRLFAAKRGALLALLFTLLTGDLLVFGKLRFGVGFEGNISSFREPAVTATLPRDGRWLDARRDEYAVFPPNRNLLTGHALLGAYSPLLDKDYYAVASDFGVLDDSFGRLAPTKQAFERRGLLNFLGAKHLVVPDALELEGFGEPAAGIGHLLYDNDAALPEFTLVFTETAFPSREAALKHLKSPAFNPLREAVSENAYVVGALPGDAPAGLEVVRNDAHFTAVDVRTDRGGTLVRSQTFDKGWLAHLDGKPVKLRRLNLAFQGVRVPPGRHRIEFTYAPASFIIGRWFCAGGLVLAALGALFAGKIVIGKRG